MPPTDRSPAGYRRYGRTPWIAWSWFGHCVTWAWTWPPSDGW
ncbi:hypothetical protein NKG94_24435 [Micromonospora sp. M12]